MKFDTSTEQCRIIPENEIDIRIGTISASASNLGEPSNRAVLKIHEPMPFDLSLFVVTGLSKLSLIQANEEGTKIDTLPTYVGMTDQQLNELVKTADLYVSSCVGMPE